MNRRDFLKTAVAGATPLAVPGVSMGRPKKARKPNIIFILADDLGYGDLGCFGQKRIKTPHIDRMAKEGMRLTEHYAGSTVCAPSRCCLMTGFHTGHARIRGNGGGPLQPGDVTVAELLKGAGYATALIGKWGLGEEGTTGIPNRQGFDYFFGYLNQRHAHNYYPSYLWRNQKKVELPNVVTPIHKASSSHGGVATKRVVYSHDLFAEETFDFVEKQKDGPFFLYLALTIPHANNEAKDKGMEVPDLGIYKNEDWPEPQKGHAAMITRMDRDVGKLFKKIKDLGLDEDTLVIFTSDNGPHSEGGGDSKFFDSNGPLKGMKRDLYEGGIRVPTVARWPGRIEPGTQSAHASAFWDFLPTACEVAGVAAPAGVDGISYLPALLGKKQKKHEYLYWEFVERNGKQAVRLGQWKGVRQNVKKDANAPIELYHLKRDPGEEDNVADKNRDIVRKFDGLMRTARTVNPHFKLFPDETDSSSR